MRKLKKDKKNEDMKVNEIVKDIYRDAYKEAYPPADYDELRANPPTKVFGDGSRHEEIDYNGHEIGETRFSEIVESHIKKNKLKGEIADKVRFGAFFGLGPKVVKDQSR